ncbi:MAG TPA: protein translocase subunit SecD [Bryobacteraceae bacterium]|jgi:preprotein translocase subunit SecD|nr:protein translocase subunit SecD [Bryobacteraceae bacterium]
MKRNLRFKFIFIVVVILICIYGIIGLPRNKEQLIANWNHNIRLGLDLRGGTYLVVRVEQQDAFNAQANTDAERLKQAAAKAGVTYSDVTVDEAKSLADATKAAIVVKGVPSTQAGTFRSLVNDQFSQWLLTPTSGTDYRLTMKPSEALAMWQNVLTQTKNTLDKKVNALGLSEATVQQRREDADSELLVQLPDIDDPGRVKQILQTAAKLELYDVRGGPYASREEALAQNNGILPPGTKLIGSASTDPAAHTGGVYLVASNPEVRGPDIRDAREQQAQLSGQWNTSFVLSQDAAKRFSAYTGSHVGQRLAIVLDGKVLEAPVIKGQISDQGEIEGAASQQDAHDLALNLKAGTLPAAVTYEQENTVGASLGADSIRNGFAAGIAGVLAVIVAMLIYYKKAGVNATLALVLNAVILIACLSYFDAVLTLPGIAGIILTIGMAVDSNVLIFERIREELRAGKSVIPAVDNGFSKALLTIIDTHVTTVVSCAILFLFGSGPVKGFAVTLVIGLIANVFTAVFVSKAIFDWELSGPKPARALSI